MLILGGMNRRLEQMAEDKKVYGLFRTVSRGSGELKDQIRTFQSKEAAEAYKTYLEKYVNVSTDGNLEYTVEAVDVMPRKQFNNDKALPKVKEAKRNALGWEKHPDEIDLDDDYEAEDEEEYEVTGAGFGPGGSPKRGSQQEESRTVADLIKELREM